MALFAAGTAVAQSDMAPRKLFDELRQELDEYLEQGLDAVQKQKPPRSGEPPAPKYKEGTAGLSGKSADAVWPPDSGW